MTDQEPHRLPPVNIVMVGHVDHGKSTLAGRLLHETGSLPDGRLAEIEAASARRGVPFEWSFLLDALQQERDQGVTIETTRIKLRGPSRDIMLIDAPGHLEFLRNMITGASHADGAVLMIDACDGVQEQTRRHVCLLDLLGIEQVVVAVNKMDRVDFDPVRFSVIADEIRSLLEECGHRMVAVVPLAARDGNGVVRHVRELSWYEGPGILGALERCAPALPRHELPLRFPVQAVYRIDDRRIIAGRIEAGALRVEDEIAICPAGKIARVKSFETWPSSHRTAARAGECVGITLDRDLFIERGDVIAHPSMAPLAVKRIRARIFWLDAEPLKTGDSLVCRVGPQSARFAVTGIVGVIDLANLRLDAAVLVTCNQMAEIRLTSLRPIAVDRFEDIAPTGRFAMERHGRLVGGGITLALESAKRAAAVDIVPVGSAVAAAERQRRYHHDGGVVFLTGLPASGKTTLALALERFIFDAGGLSLVLDGDTLRAGLNDDLGFAREDRRENIRRIAHIGAHLARSGCIAVVAAVAPRREDREQAQRLVGDHFFEIHVATSREICEARDPKGHYAKARSGQLAGFTGISDEYEAPTHPSLELDCGACSVPEAVEAIMQLLRHKNVVRF